MRIEQKIADMGLELIAPTASLANYIPTVRTGNLLFVAVAGLGIIAIAVLVLARRR